MKRIDGRLVVLAPLALALTVLSPLAFHHTSASPDFGAHPTHTVPVAEQDPIPGLMHDSLKAAAASALPGATVSDDVDPENATGRFVVVSVSGPMGQSVDFSSYRDGTVSIVQCSATTGTPATSPALRLCLGSRFTGADVPDVTSWAQAFFAKPVTGAALEQNRDGAHWSLRIDRYLATDPLTFEISIQPGTG